jgi:Na+/proline symporter
VLLVGLIVWFIVALISGLIDGAIILLVVGSLGHIASVETISWNGYQFWKSAIPPSIFGLMVGLIHGLGESRGLIGGLIVGLILGLAEGQLYHRRQDRCSVRHAGFHS